MSILAAITRLQQRRRSLIAFSSTRPICWRHRRAGRDRRTVWRWRPASDIGLGLFQIRDDLLDISGDPWSSARTWDAMKRRAGRPHFHR
ncbi:MAG: hypothetical protein R3D03_01420 [Geminicoccaceae bacterium]